MEQPVIIFGAGGLGRLAVEIFRSNGIMVYGFLDDSPGSNGEGSDEIPILGTTDDPEYLKLLGRKCQAFVAEDNNAIREKLITLIKEKRKVMPVNAIHQQAYVSTTASLGHGNLIGAGVIVNTHARIGNHCILHSQSLVDFDATLGDFVQLGAGCVVGASARIDTGVFIGAGATVIPGVTLGSNARIGAGSVVVADVPEKQTVFGNPAQPVANN